MAGLPACTAPELEVDLADVKWSQPLIKDGYVDTDDTGVMALTRLSGTLCSSSLIAPNVLLTARHCVSRSPQQVNCNAAEFGPLPVPSTVLGTTADVVTAGNGGEFVAAAVVGLAGYPGIPGAVESDIAFCGNDIAIVILDENVPESAAVPYEPRLESNIAPDLPYYAVGYGAVNGAGDDAGTRRRRDDLSVICDGEQGCIDAEILDVHDAEWAGNGGVCSGDSGGPALDLENRVIGVTSRGDVDCELSVYANPAAYAQWVKDATVYASGMGLYEAPAWTAGSTVNPEFSLPMGEVCTTGEDCASGRCVVEEKRSYCSRPCAEEGPCPEGFECDANESICLFPALVEPPRFKRGDSDGCAIGGPERRVADGAWLLLGLMLLGARRRR